MTFSDTNLWNKFSDLPSLKFSQLRVSSSSLQTSATGLTTSMWSLDRWGVQWERCHESVAYSSTTLEGSGMAPFFPRGGTDQWTVEEGYGFCCDASMLGHPVGDLGNR